MRASALVPAVLFLAAWFAFARGSLVDQGLIPTPAAVWKAFLQQFLAGTLVGDLVASLFRMVAGFLVAAGLAIPAGLALGSMARTRAALLPYVNFLRNLSPLAWLPFAVLWFGIGDAPAVFLIALSSFFPLCLGALAAVARVPRTYVLVAEESGWTRARILTGVVFPCVLPDLVTSLRVTAGVAWMVIVPAEMLSGRDGLGFSIMDARNGLRVDLLVVYMIVIGLVGVVIDGLFVRAMRSPSLRWGYSGHAVNR